LQPVRDIEPFMYRQSTCAILLASMMVGASVPVTTRPLDDTERSVSAIPARVASSNSDWSRLARLKRGSEIIVTGTSGWTTRARFVSADPSELVISTPVGQVEHVARREVATIKKQRPKVAYYMISGAMAAGLLLAGGAIGHAMDAEAQVPILGVLVVGVGGGLLFHALYPNLQTIYRAP
jgi:hypothetical protein